MTNKEGFELEIQLEIQIEELEAKVAPDGGETVAVVVVPPGKKH